MLRVPYPDLLDVLLRATTALGLSGDRAALCARIFAEATRDGVASHGINRFPRFARQVAEGVVDVAAEPECREALGALERWSGNAGVGILNAWQSMDRAIVLARTHGIGCVALADTNHWMRGGTYGWQAADTGMIGVCWSNSMPNLPPWGGVDARLGNNPLVIAVPRAEGHVVLDMAVSQFSYGALESHARAGKRLPVPGGYDRTGALTDDPAALAETGRILPIGYWKGSGLSLALDLVASLLSGGRSVSRIEPDPIRETGLSQVFIAIAPERLGGNPEVVVDDAIAFMKASEPVDSTTAIRYPGERTLQIRHENEQRGVPVDPSVWGEVRLLAGY
ncbi:MAG TPA: 3-dehydro-L-gulonate 2-dehydrogenase [Rhodothermales bacterium]